MKTKDRKRTGKRWVLLGTLMAAVMAVGSFAMGETPGSPDKETPVQPTAAGVSASPRAAGHSITAGAFTLTGENLTENTDYSYASNVLTIQSSKAMTIQNTNPGETADRITIQLDSSSQAAGAHLTLAGVNIKPSSGAALEIEENATYNVNITLAEGSENILTATGDKSAGLQKNGDSTTVTNLGWLTIDGTGSLKATGGKYGAGIGGGAVGGHVVSGCTGSNIKIKSGQVEAIGDGGAGIGGGGTAGDYGGSGNNITITGGTVTATGGSGAGIGGGCEIDGNNITITGGTVTATGGNGVAGIGGGIQGGGRGITITGGTVTATGGDGGAGIGGGVQGTESGITINGGTVMATGGAGAAGIGGGRSATGSGNKLEGDAVVLATSGGTDKEALEGFDAASGGSLTKGIAFTRQTASGDWTGMMYGSSVTVRTDAAFPADLTVANGQTLTVNDNTVLLLSEGATLQNEGKLINNGILHNVKGTILSKGTGITTNMGELENDGTITCEGSGQVTTRVSYLEDESNLNDRDVLYQNASGVQTYTNEDLPKLERGEKVASWYSNQERTNEVKVGNPVQLNTHLLFAKWGVNPTPGPTPGPTPTPTPGPGNGGSNSAKTGDPFAGGMALALLGTAAVAGIALKKRK